MVNISRAFRMERGVASAAPLYTAKLRHEIFECRRTVGKLVKSVVVDM